ncbi:type I restriction-modification system, DNA-methyltransferase subunit M [Nanobdella aerobiophila]|uniref:site-specific DNA-methyltransferase (adenine-specific) n=1 Tax=Nanobdella aerobiophila TaxID=2586965 RepID=A0A915SAG2_9ARCH|nr:SAM-dependent methyltransferase [Nanobdella aerobiophila]BBL45742.1 type I restriction-modification system, DNA-methyltransferase subunit M [Nanobdella aerobiophila]
MPQRKLDLIYLKLQESFGEKEFTIEDILKRNIFNYNRDTLITIINRLEKEGKIVQVGKDENDERIRIYKLRRLNELNQSGLTSSLKQAADLVRDMSEGYKILLIILIYKAISDIWLKEYEELKEKFISKGLSEKEAEEEARNQDYHKIKIDYEFLFKNVLNKSEKITENIRNALKNIADKNKELSDSINRLLRFIDDLIGKEGSDLRIRNVMEIFNRFDFSELGFDALGNAYEWLIEQFMPAQKKAGELFTPREVIRLLVEITEPSKERKKILDPAAGSGGMLIEAYKYVKDKYGEDVAKELILEGQEINSDTYAILKLNFIIHGIDLGKNIKLYEGDSLTNPLFIDDKPFDIVIFNPPWNMDYPSDNLKKSKIAKNVYDIFGYPPNNSADWAWIELSLYAVNDNGKVGIIIDNGALFRGGKEKIIRAKILEKDLIECVILLPDELFYNTGAPGVIIIFNKNKSLERKRNILFIDASKYYEDHPYIRKMNKLSEEGIKKILEVYKEWKEISGFSKIVSIEEVIKNDYSLNVNLYVSQIVEEENIDIKAIKEELYSIQKEISNIDAKIIGWIEDITNII